MCIYTLIPFITSDNDRKFLWKETSKYKLEQLFRIYSRSHIVQFRQFKGTIQRDFYTRFFSDQNSTWLGTAFFLVWFQIHNIFALFFDLLPLSFSVKSQAPGIIFLLCYRNRDFPVLLFVAEYRNFLSFQLRVFNICLADYRAFYYLQRRIVTVPDHDGGRPKQINAWFLYTHMVYL